MAQPGREARITHARLVGVDFPGMQVEDERLAFALVDRAQAGARIAIGQQPEVTAARDRQLQRAEPGRRQREFEDPPAVRRRHVLRKARCAGYSVLGVTDREQARVVAKAELEQDVERPQALAGDRVGRGAVTVDGATQEVLEMVLGPCRLGPEHLRRLPVDEFVTVAVTGDFMPGRGDAPDQIGFALGDPAQREERGLDAALGEHRKQPLGVGDHPRFPRLPTRAVDVRKERRHLEPVLDIDGQRVSHRRTDQRGIAAAPAPTGAWCCGV